MLRQSLLVAPLLVFVAAPAWAEVRLAIRTPENRLVSQLVEFKMEQTLTLAGMPLETTVEQFMNVRSESGQRDDAGNLPVKTSFNSMQVTLNAPGGFRFSFDSNDNAAPPAEGDPARALHDMYAAIAKSSWTHVYGRDHRVKEVRTDIPQELRDNPFVGDLLQGDHLREERNQEIDRLPDGPVSEGDTWKRVHRANMGGGQTLTFDIEYTYAGTVQRGDRTLHRITGKPTKVTYAQSPNSPGPLRVTQSELKASGEVEMLFDPRLGDVAESTHEMRVTGDMTLNDGTQDLPGKLDLKMNSKAQVQP